MLKSKRKKHKNERGRYWVMSQALKKHSNSLTRSRTKLELHKIKKYEDYEFNFVYKYTRMLQWVYD